VKRVGVGEGASTVAESSCTVAKNAVVLGGTGSFSAADAEEVVVNCEERESVAQDPLLLHLRAKMSFALLLTEAATDPLLVVVVLSSFPSPGKHAPSPSARSP
jgi:hypothetical protein